SRIPEPARRFLDERGSTDTESAVMTLTAVPALDEHRTTRISPPLSPSLLRHELPVDATVAETVTRSRAEVVDILDGRDDRLIVVVGPCSIHDPDAAMDYAHRLAEHSERVAGELRVVMRAYFEKPRSTVGWKGLINDPEIGRASCRERVSCSVGAWSVY